MNIVCAICKELFKPNDEIDSVPCGHIYHHKCLTQWLVRSSSCPQCRQETARSAVRRVFFNFSHDDSMEKDPTVLQAEAGKLKFQASLTKEELSKCEPQNNGILGTRAGHLEILVELTSEVEVHKRILLELQVTTTAKEKYAAKRE